MFSSFTTPSTQYTPNNFQQCFPMVPPNNSIQEVSVNKPYELKNPDGSLKGYFWYYGNSVELVFNLSGQITSVAGDNYVTINQVLKSLTLIGSIYDFRHNKILSFSNEIGAEYPLILETGNTEEVEGAIVSMNITREISLKLIKGNYYIDLIATHPSGYCETLFDADSCVFEVK